VGPAASRGIVIPRKKKCDSSPSSLGTGASTILMEHHALNNEAQCRANREIDLILVRNKNSGQQHQLASDRRTHYTDEKWNRVELRGLTYLHTDRGPMRKWLHTIGKAEDPFCECGETQNAAHLLASGCIGGKRRRWEDIWSDRDFCAEVATFLGRGGG